MRGSVRVYMSPVFFRDFRFSVFFFNIFFLFLCLPDFRDFRSSVSFFQCFFFFFISLFLSSCVLFLFFSLVLFVHVLMFSHIHFLDMLVFLRFCYFYFHPSPFIIFITLSILFHSPSPGPFLSLPFCNIQSPIMEESACPSRATLRHSFLATSPPTPLKKEKKKNTRKNKPTLLSAIHQSRRSFFASANHDPERVSDGSQSAEAILKPLEKRIQKKKKKAGDNNR